MMRRFVQAFSLLWLGAFVCSSSGQTKPNNPCKGPYLNLFKSAPTANEGDKVVFNADIDLPHFDEAGLSYNWSVFPKGKITFDSRTPRAILDTEGLGGHEVIIMGEAWPVEGCTQHASISLMVRRKPPYSKADEFWWWFQLNQTVLSGYNDEDYEDWLAKLRDKLREVDGRLTIEIKTSGPDPMKEPLIVGYRGKRYDERLVKDFVRRAPVLAGFEIVIAKP